MLVIVTQSVIAQGSAYSLNKADWCSSSETSSTCLWSRMTWEVNPTQREYQGVLRLGATGFL